MGNFKLNGITPEEGKLKVGAADVKRIYQGNAWVWPLRDDSYEPPAASTFNFIANVERDSDAGEIQYSGDSRVVSENGFNLFDTDFNVVTPKFPFGPLPKASDDPDYDPEGKIFGTPVQFYVSGYHIYHCSYDYKYMLAIAKIRPHIYGGQQYTPYSGSILCDRIVQSSDYGQTWHTLIDISTLDDFDGFLNIQMSKNGQTIFIQYRKKLYEDRIVTDTSNDAKVFRYPAGLINLISNDYGKSFKEKKLKHPELKEYTIRAEKSYFDDYPGSRKYRFVNKPESSRFGDHGDIEYRRIGSGITNQTNYISIGYSDSDVFINKIDMSATGKYIVLKTAHSVFFSSNTNEAFFNRILLSSDFGKNFKDITEALLNADGIPYGNIRPTYPVSQTSLWSPRYVVELISQADVGISGDGKRIMVVSKRQSNRDNTFLYWWSFDYGETFAINNITNNRNTEYFINKILPRTFSALRRNYKGAHNGDIKMDFKGHTFGFFEHDSAVVTRRTDNNPIHAGHFHITKTNTNIPTRLTTSEPISFIETNGTAPFLVSNYQPNGIRGDAYSWLFTQSCVSSCGKYSAIGANIEEQRSGIVGPYLNNEGIRRASVFWFTNNYSAEFPLYKYAGDFQDLNEPNMIFAPPALITRTQVRSFAAFSGNGRDITLPIFIVNND